ncbi:hypothetical protein ACIRPR_24810 [Streptomyces griseoflavus]|uniref:hypothetical protein n=1 Tax=Streptomyces griseoflavus TaxID=35619 RepID=UPI0033B67A16
MRSQDDSGRTGIGASADPGLPVFVDSTGRRARVLRRTGYAVAGTAAAYLAVLGLSLLGATPFAPDALLPPLPGDSTAPSAPQRQDQEAGPRTPSGVLDPDRGGAGDAGTAVGPGSLLVPLLTPPDGPLLAPATPPVPGEPVPAEPDPPAPADPPAPQEPDAPAPDEPSAPAPDDPSAPATGGDPVPPPPPDDPPAPEPPPGTPQPTPPSEPQAPSGPPVTPDATGGPPPGGTPAAGTP